MSNVLFLSPNRPSSNDRAFIKEVERRVAHLKTVQAQLETELKQYERILQLDKLAARVSDG